ATIGASAAAGGLFFISRASLLKKVGASKPATASMGGAFMSTPGSVGTSAGGGYGLPHSLSGGSLYWAWMALTGAESALPLGWVRPTTRTMSVGDLSSLRPAGRVPVHCGPVTTKFPLPVPVVRVPGEAKTLVQASSMGMR